MVPSLPSRLRARSQKTSNSSWQSRSRASWVMRRDAFSVKTKSSGVWSAQPFTALSLGRR